MNSKQTITNRWTAPIEALGLAVAFLASTATGHADILYVSTWGNTIEKYDLATGAHLGVFANTGLDHPMGLAFDRAGNLYAANAFGDAFGNTIMKFTPDGVRSVFANTRFPGGLAFDRGGNLYVANGGETSNAITKYTPNGVGTVFASAGLHNPTGLAFDNTGNLYAANYRYIGPEVGIRKFTPDGVGSLFANSGLVYPIGLAFDHAGNLYAANQYSSTIEKFSPTGADLGVFASSGLNEPAGLAFDSVGNLYVANELGWIEKFTPDGVGLVFAYTGFTGSNYPMFIAIQVPEPSNWALIVLGLSAFCALRRPKE